MLVIVVLLISVCIQFVSAYFALRLIKEIGGKLAWVTLASAIFLMAVRRSISLYYSIQAFPNVLQNVQTEVVALIISVCILVAVISIAPLFKRLLSMEARLFKQKERAQVTLESIADGVITIDQLGIIHFVNIAAEKLIGQSYGELKDKKLKDIFCTDCDSEDNYSSPLHTLVAESIKKQKTLTYPEEYIKNLRGEMHCVDVTISPLKSEEKLATGGAVLVFRDVTELRQVEEELSYKTTHDPLTNLITRSDFEKKMASLFESVIGNKEEHAVLNISLDRDQLQLLMDSEGLDGKDRALIQASTILESIVDRKDCVTRVNHSDFRVLIENVNHKKIENIAKNIIDSFLEKRFKCDFNQYELSVCIGVAMLTPKKKILLMY